MKKGEGVSTFTGQQDLTFEGNAAALGTCPVTVTGTVEDGNADMTINVKVPTLQQTVKVTYSGVKQVAESGGNLFLVHHRLHRLFILIVYDL